MLDGNKTYTCELTGCGKWADVAVCVLWPMEEVEHPSTFHWNSWRHRGFQRRPLPAGLRFAVVASCEILWGGGGQMHLVLCLMELKHKLDHKLGGILTNDSSKKSIVTPGAFISLLNLKCNQKFNLSDARVQQPAMWIYLTHPSWWRPLEGIFNGGHKPDKVIELFVHLIWEEQPDDFLVKMKITSKIIFFWLFNNAATSINLFCCYNFSLFLGFSVFFSHPQSAFLFSSITEADWYDVHSVQGWFRTLCNEDLFSSRFDFSVCTLAKIIYPRRESQQILSPVSCRSQSVNVLSSSSYQLLSPVTAKVNQVGAGKIPHM